jgi:hypothetical protein
MVKVAALKGICPKGMGNDMMRTKLILLSALVGGIAMVGTRAANAALVHDIVTFTASDFNIDVGPDSPPVDPVSGSFTISFDPTLSYTDETAGITLTPGSLNIALGSTLSFSYNAPTSMLPATTLVVGGISDGAQQVFVNPSSNLALHQRLRHCAKFRPGGLFADIGICGQPI